VLGGEPPAGVTKLLPEQEALLAVLREAAKVSRKPFTASGSLAGDSIQHDGLTESPPFEWDDLDILIRKGLLHRSDGSRRTNHMRFTVTAEGFAHASTPEGPKLRPVQVQPLDALDSVRRLFDSAPTGGPYAEAFAKWAAAEAMLWTAKEEPSHLTAVGIVCRDTLQRFADVFAREQGYVSTEPASKTINRVVGGIAALRGRLSDRHLHLLDALDTYWRAVDGCAQRQVHAAEKGGEPIEWEDARLVVTQTAVVMFELMRAAARGSTT
jgi:hypothetical protein